MGKIEEFDNHKHRGFEEDLEDFRLSNQPDLRVNIYEAYPKGSKKVARVKLFQVPHVDDLNPEKIYRQTGPKRLFLRVLDIKGRERGSSRIFEIDIDFFKRMRRSDGNGTENK